MENGQMKPEVLQAALAGLLHDVGKFIGHAGVGFGVSQANQETSYEVGYFHAQASATFVEEYVPKHLREQGIRAVNYHNTLHNLRSEDPKVTALAKLVWLADGWAANERQEDKTKEQAHDTYTPLVPVLSRVQLLHESSSQNWRYRLNFLNLEAKVIFPDQLADNDPLVDPDCYMDLWDKEMRPELDGWKKSSAWESISPQAYFVTLLALFRKYFTFVPSATPWQADEDDRVLPDVSLYDHLKTTAAIAACLRAGFSDEQITAMNRNYDQPVAVLVRGDISGIQRFIYRITQPNGEGEFAKAAKRLRGRSFYLGLLGDIVVDWLTRELGVTPANVLFSGGGRFDILAPVNCQEKIRECQKQLSSWLLEKFYGELGILIETAEVKPYDFGDMSPVYEAIETRLGESKQRKWLGHLQDTTFFSPKYQKYHACRVCRITPLEDPEVCELCKEHEKIGKVLPHVTHIAIINGKYQESPGFEKFIHVHFPAPFNATALLLLSNEEQKADEAARFVANVTSSGPITIYRLNETGSDNQPLIAPNAPPNLGQSFYFLANTAPKARVALNKPDVEEPIEKGDVLHFDAIARLGDGVRRIGILKADVDRLGLVFGLGIQPSTISRVSNLSHTIDLFFSGWLNRLCERVFIDWENEQAARKQAGKPVSPLYGRVDGLFYVMYSGGDDLFIIGPWDEILTLAKQLNADFSAYACKNLNITLSAGYVQVKPHYPVQRFATLVDDAEKQAKNTKKWDNDNGRNAIHAFGDTVTWTEEVTSFDKLLEFAKQLRKDVEDYNVPRTLVHDLINLKYRKDKTTLEEKPVFTPRLYYTLTRRLRKEMLDRYLENDLIIKLHHIMIPASYVSLCTRKE